jgi:hypothetical protein
MKLLDVVFEAVVDISEILKMTQDEFISRSRIVHDAKRIEQGRKPYTYENVNYVNNKTKVFITCHEKDEDGIEHGVFSRVPKEHLEGGGCAKCSGNKKSNTDEFIQKAHAVHDTKRIEQGIKPYTYENVNYVNSGTDVLITCPEHGIFSQSPNTHLRGNGCAKCSGNKKSNTDEFIQKAHAVHDTKRINQGREPYVYSKVNYINSKTYVDIICPEHGAFSVSPNGHLKGRGCAKCSGIAKSNTDEFIQKAKKVHDEKRVINGKEPYDYTEVKYVNNKTHVIIICNEKYVNDEKHGPFLQSATNHLKGGGCPICNELKGETDIKLILSKNNIKFIPQYQYEDCTSFKKSSKNKICKLLSFDFYLPKFKTLIEFDGFYHFNEHPKNNDNDKFMSDVLNDREKNIYTKLNDIKLIRISYLDGNNIGEEIRNGLLSKNQLYLSKGYGEHKTGWVDNNFQPTDKFIKKYT